MKRFMLAIAAVTAVAFLAAPAQAGVLTSLLTFDGKINDLKDNSAAQVFDSTGHRLATGASLGVGDIIVGVLRIDHRVQSTPTDAPPSGSLPANDQLIAVFSEQITGVTPSGLITNAAVNPALGTGLSIKELLASSYYNSGQVTFTGTNTPIAGGGTDAFWSNTAVAVLESTTAPDPLGLNQDGLTTVQQVGSNTPPSGSYILDALAGFNPGDFLSDHQTNGLPGVVDANFTADERGGLTLFATNMGTTQWLPVPVTDFSPPAGTGATTSHQLDLRPVTQVTGTGGGNWDFTDSATFSVDPVAPEPTTLLIWGLGVVGFCARRIRRRRE